MIDRIDSLGKTYAAQQVLKAPIRADANRGSTFKSRIQLERSLRAFSSNRNAESLSPKAA